MAVWPCSSPINIATTANAWFSSAAVASGLDLNWILRILSAPGAELVLPVVAPQPVLNLGNKLGSWLASAGIQSPRAGEMWSAYCSLSDRPTRQAFLRTLRSVVDYRGQAVSALGKIHVSHGLPTLLIWGDQDRIIPVAHGYAARPGRAWQPTRVLAGVGHFPHVESPAAVVDILDDFIANHRWGCRSDESPNLIRTTNEARCAPE